MVDGQEVDPAIARQRGGQGNFQGTRLLFQLAQLLPCQVQHHVHPPGFEVGDRVVANQEANFADARQADFAGPAAVIRVGHEDSVARPAAFDAVALVLEGPAAQRIAGERVRVASQAVPPPPAAAGS